MVHRSAFTTPFITRPLNERRSSWKTSTRIFRFPCPSPRRVIPNLLDFRCSATQSDSPSTERVPTPAELNSTLFNVPSPQSAFGVALTTLFNSRNNGDQQVASIDILGSVLSQNVEWSTPLFTLNGVNEVTKNIDALLSFVMNPRIAVVNERRTDRDPVVLEIDWNFSFVYPLPWRPRVSFSVRSYVTSNSTSDCLTAVQDTWSRSPWTVLRQALPPISDILWLWPSPHAETDIGLRKLVLKTPDYAIESYSAHAEFRVRDEVQPSERVTVWALGVLPSEAFASSLRKKEVYEAVSPISVRCIENNLFEWAVAQPGSKFGVDVLSLVPPCENARNTWVPERRLAVRRYSGYASRDRFVIQRDELLEALVRDGLLSETQAEEKSRVWSRLYDSKLGFNAKGEPCIATYGSTLWVPRVNEVAVELD